MHSTPLEDLLLPTVRSAAVIAAAQLNLFDELSRGPRSAEQISQALDIPETGVTAILEVLAHSSYVSRTGSQFILGPMGQVWLSPESTINFDSFLLWAAEVWNILEGTAQTIRKGRPENRVWERIAARPELGSVFSEFMKTKSLLTVDTIVKKLELNGKYRMVDIGGAHGLHSIKFCQQYPKLRSTIVDLPASLKNTPDAIEQAGLTDRITTRAGNYMQDPLGDGYDVALCFELLHGHSIDECRRLIAKSSASLIIGGKLVILEHLREKQPNAGNAAFSMLMFLYTATRTYEYEEITGWLKDAGFGGATRIDLSPDGGLSLVVSEKIR